jgi:hypothetical protein
LWFGVDEELTKRRDSLHAGLFSLAGAAYTCKDLAESLAGKDRYEFEKFFAPRTVLTLSESVFRFIDTRQMIPV